MMMVGIPVNSIPPCGSVHIKNGLVNIRHYSTITKSIDIITHLKLFHCIPVKVRRTCKTACLCYHCHHKRTIICS